MKGIYVEKYFTMENYDASKALINGDNWTVSMYEVFNFENGPLVRNQTKMKAIVKGLMR